MADHGVFTKYAGMGMLPSYTVEPGASDHELKVTDHPPEDMHSAIAAALDLPAITVLTASRTSAPRSGSSGMTAATCWRSSREWSSPTSGT